MTSMGPFLLDDFIDYLEDDFKAEMNWPFSKQDLISFINGDAQILNERQCEDKVILCPLV